MRACTADGRFWVKAVIFRHGMPGLDDAGGGIDERAGEPSAAEKARQGERITRPYRTGSDSALCHGIVCVEERLTASTVITGMSVFGQRVERDRAEFQRVPYSLIPSLDGPVLLSFEPVLSFNISSCSPIFSSHSLQPNCPAWAQTSPGTIRPKATSIRLEIRSKQFGEAGIRSRPRHKAHALHRTSPEKVISPSFTICTGTANNGTGADGDADCGTAVWPSVEQNGTEYSISLSVPSDRAGATAADACSLPGPCQISPGTENTIS